MKIRIEIDTDNAAFEDPANEVACILRKLADRIDLPPYQLEPADSVALMESDGNRCGFFMVEAES